MEQRIILSDRFESDLALCISECEHDGIFIICDTSSHRFCWSEMAHFPTLRQAEWGSFSFYHLFQHRASGHLCGLGQAQRRQHQRRSAAHKPLQLFHEPFLLIMRSVFL